MSDRQRWFSARLLFESNPALFEERLILLRSAAGLDDAEKRAKALGKRDQQDYKNLAGQEIVWGFTEVLDVVELDSPVIDEGSEVYCHFLFPFEVEEIKASLKPGSLG